MLFIPGPWYSLGGGPIQIYKYTLKQFRYYRENSFLLPSGILYSFKNDADE